MGLFDQLDGARTVSRLASAPNGQIFGNFHKSLPLVPLWSADGNTRMGFTQLFNGYVRGPENTSLDMLQSAVKLGQIPGVPVDAVVTPEDYYDSLYIMAGSTSIFDAYVHLPEEHPVTPPPAGGGDAATIADLTKRLTAAEAEIAKDDAIFGSITTIANKALDIMGPRGGGAPIAKARASFKAILAALS